MCCVVKTVVCHVSVQHYNLSFYVCIYNETEYFDITASARYYCIERLMLPLIVNKKSQLVHQ